MIRKNILITAVIISLIGHMAIIAISGMIVFNGSGSADKPFTVHLESKATSIGSKPVSIKSSTEQDHPIPEGTQGKGEAVVELGDRQTKYYSYLTHLKRKFEQRWTYPRDAYTKKEKGVSVVRFSIAETGNLADVFILSSSGHKALDGEALRVIQSSCPFNPLPAEFNLSMLHVIARFQYNLAE
jgi:protein TonB